MFETLITIVKYKYNDKISLFIKRFWAYSVSKYLMRNI